MTGGPGPDRGGTARTRAWPLAGLARVREARAVAAGREAGRRREEARRVREEAVLVAARSEEARRRTLDGSPGTPGCVPPVHCGALASGAASRRGWDAFARRSAAAARVAAAEALLALSRAEEAGSAFRQARGRADALDQGAMRWASARRRALAARQEREVEEAWGRGGAAGSARSCG